MALLIDPPSWPGHGRLWSHLISDVSFEELHAFARALGVPARGFEGDHYDLPAERYAAAVAAGAVPVPSRELLRRLRAAGLRRPKRTGEKVVGSLPSADGRSRVDTLASSRVPRRAASEVVLLAARPGAAQLLALPGPVVPRRGVAGSTGLLTAARQLAAEVFETVPGVPRQIGYLRALGPGPDAVRIDVVVHLDAAPAPPIRPPGRWVTSSEVAQAHPALAPLIALVLAPSGG